MEARLFEEGTIPEFTTPEWYANRERAPHLEQPPHQGRLYMAHDFVVEAVMSMKAPDGSVPFVVDLGAGDGGLLALLKDGIGDNSPTPHKGWGYDLQESNLLGAQERGVMVGYLDVVARPEKVAWAPVAIATEMLEHLVDPHAFVRSIESEVLVASSPVNETAESHYAFHLWAWDMVGYRALLEQGGYVIDRHEETGGFQVIRGRRS